MKVQNKEFWENEAVIATQDRPIAGSSDYEVYLYQKVAAHLQNNQKERRAKVFGCGTGREIPEVIRHIGIHTVVASDIAENMIKKCKENLQNWGLTDRVTTQVGDAAQWIPTNDSFDVVTIMNNMLTYVIDKKQRQAIFKNAHQLLNPDGCIIGVVHHQMGTPQKSLYFLIRRLVKPFLKSEVGYRLTGFKGMKFGGHYFSKKEVYDHLNDNGFKNIEIIALADYYEQKNVPYNRWKGYNNLLFFATRQ